MSRNASPRTEAAQLVDLSSGDFAQDVTAANTLAALKSGVSSERDLINQMLGQAQAFNAIATFSKALHTAKLAHVKQNKLYRQMAGMVGPDGTVLTGTWDEFCRQLGMSPDKADLDIANLRTFGEEAFDGMTRMGVGYRDFAQYRKLPEDTRTLLIETAKTGDKTAFLDLAEELMERHTKERDALKAELAETQASLAAKDKVLSEEMDKGRELREQLARPWEPAAPGLAARSAEEETTLMVLAQASDTVAQGSRRLAMVVADICANAGGDTALRTKALQALTYVVATLREIVLTHGLEVEVSDDALGVRPVWLNAAGTTDWQAPGSTSPEA